MGETCFGQRQWVVYVWNIVDSEPTSGGIDAEDGPEEPYAVICGLSTTYKVRRTLPPIGRNAFFSSDSA
jgi:hypothetical protein